MQQSACAITQQTDGLKMQERVRHNCTKGELGHFIAFSTMLACRCCSLQMCEAPGGPTFLRPLP